MDGPFVPTSLRNTPSGFTDEQVDARQQAYEARLFRERGKQIVSEEDCGENVIVLAWFRNLVAKRFGRGV